MERRPETEGPAPASTLAGGAVMAGSPVAEAIEVSKRFGAEYGHTYINGVLDRAAAAWRDAEYRR